MKIHPAADCFPMMSDDRVAELAEDIKTHGQLSACITFDGQLLDGRHRAAACKLLGIAPKTEPAPPGTNPWQLVWSANGQRRDITDAVRAICFMKSQEGAQAYDEARGLVAERANESRSELKKESSKQQPRTSDGKWLPPSGACSAGPTPGRRNRDQSARTSAKIGDAIGVGRNTVEAVQSLRNNRPDLADKVHSGEMKFNEARKVAKRDAVQDKVKGIPPGQYRIIYADPPWQYGNSGMQEYGHAEFHYPTMPLQDICALPVKERTAADAVLFLWATVPLLVEGLEVMKAWGFKYKAQFVWLKDRGAWGNYNNVRHELLLIGTKGSCLPDTNVQHKSVQEIPKGKHSEKPAEFAEIINSLYPHGPRLEMFCRGKARDGWTAWGNESIEDGDHEQ